MPVQLYIVLHKTSKPKTYEWSLVPHIAGAPLPGLVPINHFEITKVRRRGHADWEWATTVKQRIFHTSHKFLGVLALPPCDDESTTVADVEEIFRQATPVPWSLSPEEQRRWTCPKWIVDILVEWGPLWGLNFISKFENRDVLLSLLNALSTWLEESRHERVSTGDGYEYSCVRCPEFLVRPSNPPVDIRRCLPARAPLAPPRTTAAFAEAR
ncbi:hypothetical protein PENSPDRAFT_203519 [Peniophora sp. CONT]|nr:hypothetical protein PENSPDRAFT_203519 [Peniophora sp. CONT]